MEYLTDSRRAAYENRIYDDHSALIQNPIESYPRRPQKKMFYIMILISIIILIGLAIPIALLYNQTSSLSQQIAALQQQNTNLQTQVTALQDFPVTNFTANLTQLESSWANAQSIVQTLNQSIMSFTTTMNQVKYGLSSTTSEVQILNQGFTINISQLEKNISTTQSDISSLNQNFVSFGQAVAGNMTQLGNILSNTESEIQSLNQNLTALETSVNASIAPLKTPLLVLLNYSTDEIVHIHPVCEGGFVAVPGVELSMSSQNGGYGICDFKTTSYSGINSSMTLDGSPITSSINAYPYVGYYLISWNNHFEFSAGNHTIGVMVGLVNTTQSPCNAGDFGSVYLFSGRLICRLYEIQDNN